MTGFSPSGYKPLAEAARAIGTERLGADLAAGNMVAFRQNAWGEMFLIPSDFWRGRYARAAMECGHVPKLRQLADRGDLILVQSGEHALTETETDHGRTGLAGRPSSRHLIGTELRRRIASGEESKSIGEEATYLSKWLADKHPQSPHIKPAGAENAIREIWRSRPLN